MNADSVLLELIVTLWMLIHVPSVQKDRPPLKKEVVAYLSVFQWVCS